MSDIKKDIVLGAILHDIGKFVMRGKNINVNHSEAGYNYLKENNRNLNKNILDCVKHHHYNNMKGLSNDNISYIIYLADNISSGVDRRISNISNEYDKAEFNKKAVLESVFNVFKDDIKSDKTFYKLNVLKDNFSFLDLIANNNETNPNDISIYNKIFNQFDSAFSRVNFETDSISSILQILELTTAFVPSSTNTKEICDISLFNHLKVTAMIASCMYEYFSVNGISDYKKACFSNNDFYDTDAFLLVSGDLSGIQNFIYTTSDKNALKMLRGRSFYLELLCQNIIDELLSVCELTQVNILYSGGGHFYGLFPNTNKIKEIIQSSTEKFNDILFKQFDSVLSISIGFSVTTASELINSKQKLKTDNLLGKVFSDCSKKISKQKMSKYSKEQLKTFFIHNLNEDKKDNDGERECSVCSSSSHLQKDNICHICDNCKELGKKIPTINEKLLVMTNNNDGLEFPSLQKEPKYLSVLSEEKTIKKLENGEALRVYSINTSKAGKNFSQNMWVGNYSKKSTEKDSYGSIEFEELASMSKGIKRIGVLRMDVDNLGQAFSKGFKSSNKNAENQYISISRTTMLSYNLSLFFKNEINKICEITNKDSFKLIKDNTEDYKTKERALAIVYAGGDDVFVVGAWNEVLEFSVDLNKAFAKFTNNKLTLSAGFSIFKDKFPISQMAQITGKLEDMAKKNEGKNSIALFSNEHVYKWSEFCENVCEKKLNFLYESLQIVEDETTKQTEKLSIGMSMIYKLMNLIRETSETDTLNIARLAYTIARLEPKQKEKAKLYNYFKTNFYNWATDVKERKELLTAIYLFVYLNRKGE